ncbi:MAG: GNAT family N-acetyltransferase [Caldimonas sp.]
MSMNSDFDPTLLSRIEDAGINASAPPQQRWADGWLVRFSPGKAKRARCINAVAAGRLPVNEKLALCEPIFREAKLPLHVRITPFSLPQQLDAQLSALGLRRQDDTRVMVRASLQELPAASVPHGTRLGRLGHHAFAELVGHLRGSTLAERKAHAERLALSPVPFHGFSLTDEDGTAVSCGQFAIEAEFVGLYDVHTAAPYRGRGYAAALCLEMIRFSRERGAIVGYLQVDAENSAARRVYDRLGFRDAYGYHYRTRDAVASAPREDRL